MIVGNSLMRLPQKSFAVNNPSMGFTTFPAKFFEFRTWLGVTTEPVHLSSSMDSSLDSPTYLRFIKREDETPPRPTNDQQKPKKQKKKEKTKFDKDTKGKKKMEIQTRPPRNATIPNHPKDKSLHGPKRTKDDSMVSDGSRRKNRTSAKATHMKHPPNQADHVHSISTQDSQIKLNNLGNLTTLDLKKSKDGRRKKPFGYDLTQTKNMNQTMDVSNHKSSSPSSQPTHKTQALSEDGKANRTTSQNTYKPSSKNSQLKPKKKKIGQGMTKNQNSTSSEPEIHSSKKIKHKAKPSNKGASSDNTTTIKTGKDKGSKNKMNIKKGKAHNLTAPSNSSSRIASGPSLPVRNETLVPTPVSQAPIESPLPSPITSEATPAATPTATSESTPTATPESAPRAASEAATGNTPESTPGATSEATTGATPDANPGTTPEATAGATPDQTAQDGQARSDGTSMTSKNDTIGQDSQAEKPKNSDVPADPMTSWIITFKMNATEDGVNQYEQKLNNTGAIIKYNYSPVLKGLAASVPDRSFTALSKDPNIDSFDPDTVMSAPSNLDGGPVVGDADVVSEDG